MIIAVAHNKGGVGKSTFVTNLAPLLNTKFIIDLDAHDSISITNSLRDEPRDVRRYSEHDADGFVASLNELEEGEVVLVDCGGFDSAGTRTAIAMADLVITPAMDTMKELIGLAAFDRTLTEISDAIGAEIKAHVLYTRSHRNTKRFDRLDAHVEGCDHLQRLTATMPHSTDYDRADTHGLGVYEFAPTKYGKAAKDMKAIADEIQQLMLP
ncbi:ParA family protein [Vibrio astriarenae]